MGVVTPKALASSNAISGYKATYKSLLLPPSSSSSSFILFLRNTKISVTFCSHMHVLHDYINFQFLFLSGDWEVKNMN